MESTATLVAAVIAATAAFIAAGISFLAQRTAVSTKARLDAASLLEQESRSFRERQLAQLYNPVLALLSVNARIFSVLGPGAARRHSDPARAEEVAVVWKSLRDTVVIRNNLRIVELIEDGLHLIDQDDTVDRYFDFVLHAMTYREFVDRPFAAYDEFRFPEGFDRHVRAEQQRLSAAYQRMTKGDLR